MWLHLWSYYARIWSHLVSGCYFMVTCNRAGSWTEQISLGYGDLVLIWIFYGEWLSPLSASMQGWLFWYFDDLWTKLFILCSLHMKKKSYVQLFSPLPRTNPRYALATINICLVMLSMSRTPKPTLRRMLFRCRHRYASHSSQDHAYMAQSAVLSIRSWQIQHWYWQFKWRIIPWRPLSVKARSLPVLSNLE